MRLIDALSVIHKEPINAFRVAYEFSDGRVVASGCFPDHATRPQEPPFESYDHALAMAERFAKAAPDGYRNIHVVGVDFKPVESDIVFRPHRWQF